MRRSMRPQSSRSARSIQSTAWDVGEKRWESGSGVRVVANQRVGGEFDANKYFVIYVMHGQERHKVVWSTLLPSQKIKMNSQKAMTRRQLYLRADKRLLVQNVLPLAILDEHTGRCIAQATRHVHQVRVRLLLWKNIINSQKMKIHFSLFEQTPKRA